MNSHPRTQPSHTLTASTTVEPPQIIYGKPVRLIVPTLGIDANVTHLGLTPAGNMDAPTKLIDTGWYKYGSHPGDAGSSVIAGHVGSPKLPGVFINLHKLKKNDLISVIDSYGQVVYFTVREIKIYSQNDLAYEVFRGNDGKYLNLITCTGDWNDSKQTFTDRLVVFADKSD